MSKQPKIRRMNRAGCYLRVSTPEQTFDSQRHEIEKYLESHDHGFHSVRWYEDQGYSGAYNKRPGYLSMMEDAEVGRIGAVIVYKLDRFNRIARDAIWSILRLDEMGVQFISVSQPMFSHNTPFRHAMIGIFAELAQMERDQIRQRVKAGMAAAKARGSQIGRVPVMTDSKRERLIELRQGNVSMKKIAVDLNVSVGVVHQTIKRLEAAGVIPPRSV